MPALDFKAQWADAVYVGAQHANGHVCTANLLPKRTTIRRPGRARPGDTLYLYTGRRTKACRRLGEALCLAVTPVLVQPHPSGPVISLDGALLSDTEAERLARIDTAGLWCADELVAFFERTYGLPFEGELIAW